MSNAEDTFAKILSHLRETAVLESVNDTIQWDDRTYRPEAGGDYRARQVTLLSGLVHRRRTDPCLGEWLAEIEAQLPPSGTPEGPPGNPAAGDAVVTVPMQRSHAVGRHEDEVGQDRITTIRMLRREYDRLSKMPQQLVQELTDVAMRGQQAWIKARQERDFSIQQPYLERMIALKQEQAQAIGYVTCPYDALLDEFEPGARTETITSVFAKLRDQLVPLVHAVAGSGRTAPVEILHREFPRDAQAEFGKLAATKIGFDFERGRLDETAHPFCTTLGPHDCRITTRYDEQFFSSAFFGTLHEAGHGIYEQGLRAEWFGLPPGRAASMGIHESQSRLWENLVGRSQPFWHYFLPIARRSFSAALRDVDFEQFCFAINHVQPSLIRVEADEATYNLHIIIRFELEQELIDGRLQVAELPEAWNQRYEKYLGITPAHDGDGVLQDIHWPAALIGYFPTYALGNLYAAQFFEQARDDLGDLEQQVARGEFAPLREWLRQNVHRHGQRFSPAELVRRISGKSLTHEPLIAHLRTKLAYYGGS